MMKNSNGFEPQLPPVVEPRKRLLSDEELNLQLKMVQVAEKFANDPEMAICSKIGLGACFEF